MNEIFFIGGLITIIVGLLVIVRSAFCLNPFLGVIILFFPFLIPFYCISKFKRAVPGLIVCVLGVGTFFAIDYEKFKQDHNEALFEVDSSIGGILGIEEPTDAGKTKEFVRPDMSFDPGTVTGLIDQKSFAFSRAIVQKNKLILVSDLVDGATLPDAEVVIDLTDGFTDFMESNTNSFKGSEASYQLKFGFDDQDATAIKVKLFDTNTKSRDVINLLGGYELDLKLTRTDDKQLFGLVSFIIPSSSSFISGEFVADIVSASDPSGALASEVKEHIEAAANSVMTRYFSRYLKEVVQFENTRWYLQNNAGVGKTTITFDLRDSRRVKMDVNFHFKKNKWKIDSTSLLAINEELKPKESTVIAVDKDEVGARITNPRKAIGRRVVIVSTKGGRRAGRLTKYGSGRATIMVPIGSEEAELHLGFGSIKAIYYPKR